MIGDKALQRRIMNSIEPESAYIWDEQANMPGCDVRRPQCARLVEVTRRGVGKTRASSTAL